MDFFAKINDICVPPIEIFKSGEKADFWSKHREFISIIEESEWLDEHGKDIPIEELEKMSE